MRDRVPPRVAGVSAARGGGMAGPARGAALVRREEGSDQKCYKRGETLIFGTFLWVKLKYFGCFVATGGGGGTAAAFDRGVGGV